MKNVCSSEMLLTSQQETRCCHYSDQLLRLSGRKHHKFNTIMNSFMICTPQEIFFSDDEIKKNEMGGACGT